MENLLSQALHTAKAGGETVVVRDHNRRVQRLEIQHQDGVAIEAGLGLHD